MNRRRLLLVDDDEACLFAMRDYFELRDFDVSCARDRAKAEREIAARCHDLVITDVDLRTDSRHEGLDIVTSCVTQWPDIQVIVLTAHGTPQVKEEALRRGAAAVLQKPMPLAEVLAAAQADFVGRSVAAEASGSTPERPGLAGIASRAKSATAATAAGPSRESEPSMARIGDTDAALAEADPMSWVQLALARLFSRPVLLDDALCFAAQALADRLDSDLVRIWLLDPAEEELVLRATAGREVDLEGSVLRVAVAESRLGRIVRERQAGTFTVALDERAGTAGTSRTGEGHAFTGVPMLVQDRVIGVLALDTREPLPAHVVARLTAVVSHLALGIEILVASDLHERRARRQAATAEIGRRGLAGADVETLMDEALFSATGILGAEFGEVFELADDGSMTPSATIGCPEGGAGTPCLPDSHAHSSQALALRAPVIVRDYRTETRFAAPPWATEHGILSTIVCAIPGNDRPLGILSIHATRPRHFHEADASFLQSIANLLSSAMLRRRAEDSRRKLEEQLGHAQKMEAIGLLAGGVAHDFNNLLTTIMGYCHLATRRFEADDAQRADIDEIREAAERAASLTRQLLAFSRKQVLQQRRLDLGELVGNLQKMMRRLIGEDVRLVCRGRLGKFRVKADPGQLEQVIMNLVVNARDAMPHGGTITIDLEHRVVGATTANSATDLEPGRYVSLSVNDTGCGMDAATRARVFEPFFTTKEPGRGTGLGLSTVYGIVKQSRGHVSLDSEPGLGSTFRILLPACEDGETIGEAASASVLPTGSETLMLVEDDRRLRCLGVRILSRLGYTVIEAADGEEALRELARIADGSIRLIVTDLVLPGMSGRELARAVSEVAAMPVLYVSGHSDHALIAAGVHPEGRDFLQKPFTPADLAQKVRDLLDRR